MMSKYLSEISLENEIQIDDDAVLISKTDASGKILYISPDFLKITGYSEKEIFQQNHLSWWYLTRRVVNLFLSSV